MQFEDFASTFSYVSMCHFKFQDNDNTGDGDDGGNWHFKRVDDSWNLASAGGCQTRDFVYNPQYVIKVPVRKRRIQLQTLGTKTRSIGAKLLRSFGYFSV